MPPPNEQNGHAAASWPPSVPAQRFGTRLDGGLGNGFNGFNGGLRGGPNNGTADIRAAAAREAGRRDAGRYERDVHDEVTVRAGAHPLDVTGGGTGDLAGGLPDSGVAGDSTGGQLPAAQVPEPGDQRRPGMPAVPPPPPTVAPPPTLPPLSPPPLSPSLVSSSPVSSPVSPTMQPTTQHPQQPAAQQPPVQPPGGQPAFGVAQVDPAAMATPLSGSGAAGQQSGSWGPSGAHPADSGSPGGTRHLPGSQFPGAAAPFGGDGGTPVPTVTPLTTLFERAPVGLALHDTSGRFLRVNDAFARLAGRPVDDFAGRAMAELFGDVGRELDGLVARVLQTGEAMVDLEVALPAGGADAGGAGVGGAGVGDGAGGAAGGGGAGTGVGGLNIWQASCYPVPGPTGTPAAAVFVALDVTRQRQAESEAARAEARYRALAEAAGWDVFHAGADGGLDTDMPRWRAVTGQHRSQLAGFGWLEAVHPEDRDRVARAWRAAVESGRPFDAEFRVRAADATERVAVAHARSVGEGRPAEWVGVITDVTEARGADATRRAAASLVDEATRRVEQAGQLAAALARAMTVDDVIAAVLDVGARAARATGRGVALVDREDDMVRFRSLLGYSDEYAALWSQVGLGAIHPLAEAVRGKRPLFIPTREGLVARWPVTELAAAVDSGGDHAWALLPLTTSEVPFGVLYFGFPTSHDFDAGEQAFLGAIAEQCARALERAMLVERLLADAADGRRAREEAEQAHAHARLAYGRISQLARASAVMADAAHPDLALAALARFVAGDIADVCAVYAVADQEDGEDRAGPDGQGRETARGAADQAGQAGQTGTGQAGGEQAAETPVLRMATMAVRPGLPAAPQAQDAVPGEVARSGQARLLTADAPALAPATREWLRGFGAHSVAAVPIHGRERVVGVLTVTAAGERPAFTEDDLPFLTELAAKAAAALDLAAAEERDPAATALAGALPPVSSTPLGLDIASGYLPAGQTGSGEKEQGGGAGEVGGDWVDVIDLGAGRIALVIGDVAGRGPRASAVSGQLRAAARTCARLDLPPAEVLTLLDGIVSDLPDDQIATCIYAVIETDSGQLTLASAGHPPPLVVAPDGLVSRLYMSVGAPLGLACDDTIEYTVSLGPGYLLALFTDGLVRGRDLDMDAGVSNLAALLARPAEDWGGRLSVLAEAACAARVRAGTAPADDVALLLVRLPAPGAVAPLDVSADASGGLSQLRAQVRLALEDASVDPDVVDTTVLVVSELAGNALVHGRSPLSVRVRRLPGQVGPGNRAAREGSRLLVEVGDSSGRLPRRRRAAPDDEAGRGLDLVGALAARWGSRPVGDGKVVWAEINEPPPATAS